MQQPPFFAVLSAPLFAILGTPLFVIPSASPCHPERFPLSSRALPLPVILSTAKDLVPPTGLSGEKILRRLRLLRMTKGAGAVADDKRAGAVPDDKGAGAVPDDKEAGAVPDDKEAGAVPDDKGAGPVPDGKGAGAVAG